MSEKRRGDGGSRRRFLAAVCAPVVAACVGCGGNTPNTKQMDDTGNVLLVVGGISVVVPAGWTQITGLILAVVGGSLKLYVIFAGGERAEVPTNTDQLQAFQEAQSKGEKVEVRANGSVKQVDIGEDK